MKLDRKHMLLYAVTDRSWLNGLSLYSQVEQALQGGATMIQLREKNPDASSILGEARAIHKLCKYYQAPFIINDYVDIALAADADGVHVGQEDMGVKTAREKLGPDKIIGVSAHNVEEALSAQANGADYIGAGAVFYTGSKKDVKALDHKILQEICEAVEIPVVAIGGISQKNMIGLKGRGVSGVAVISAIFAQKDIRAAAAELRAMAEKL